MNTVTGHVILKIRSSTQFSQADILVKLFVKFIVSETKPISIIRVTIKNGDGVGL
jgi:hypothetical protein